VSGEDTDKINEMDVLFFLINARSWTGRGGREGNKLREEEEKEVI
jgi:hypothetical protein